MSSSRTRLGGPGELASREVRRIASDRRSGALELSRRALAVVDSVARGTTSTGGSGPALPRRLNDLAHRLRVAQPAMGSLDRLGRGLARLTRSAEATRLESVVQRWVREERRRLDRELPRVAWTVARSIRPRARMLTLSRSETIRTALGRLPAARQPLEVLVLESRPGGEGRQFSRDLRRAGIAARCIPDRDGSDALGRVDLLLIGADAIERDGAVVHKVGTRRLALAARRRSIPVYVATGLSKAVDRRGRRLPAGGLFDRTPPSAVTGYWTDAGAVPGRGWRAFMSARRS